MKEKANYPKKKNNKIELFLAFLAEGKNKIINIDTTCPSAATHTLVAHLPVRLVAHLTLKTSTIMTRVPPGVEDKFRYHLSKESAVQPYENSVPPSNSS